jgi:predicted transposase YbfD/YdcC
MVSAWSADNGICLGQEKVNSKSNEITALPKLIEALDLEGCIVTIDAIGCQKSIAGAIRKAGADYLLCAKKNQKHVKNVVAALVKEEHKKDGICKWYNQVNEGHGRKEWRECVCTDFERLAPYFLEGWTDLRTLARVTEKRQLAGGEITEETRYYITSLPADPKMILKASRRHWSVENELHWRMDVAFREDYSRKTDNAAINFSAICKIALMKLKEYKLKVGVASKRKMCGWDEKTRDMVLGIR